MSVETSNSCSRTFSSALTTAPMPYRQFLFIVLCLGFIVLLASTIYAYHEKSMVLVGKEDSASILKVKLHGANLLKSVRNAESGQRGFLLTEDRAYLRPYYQSQMDYAGLETSLRQVTIAQPNTRELVDRLLANSAAKMNKLQASLQAYENHGKAAALSLINSDEGLNLMGVIEEDVAVFDNLQNKRLVEAATKLEQGLDTITVTMMASVATILALATFSILLTRRQFADIEANQKALVSLNEELDDRVERATRDLILARERAEEETVRAEREKSRVELLLHELNHRVGNNLAMVSSLVGIQASQAKNIETKEALKAARSRIALVGSAQRRLRIDDNLSSTDSATLLEDTIEDIQENSPKSGVTITAESDHLVLDSRDAITLAIMAGELVVNALKHAFPNERVGWIKVRFYKDVGDIHVLEVEDNGIGMPEDAETQSDGLGSQIIERFCTQYDAEIQRASYPQKGTKVRLLLHRLLPVETKE